MKTLITLAFVVDLDDYDELAELVQGMERQAADSMRAVFDTQARRLEDFSDRLEFYGVVATPVRETLDNPI